MKTTTGASALLLLATSVAASKHTAVHERLETLHKRHHAHRDVHKSVMERGEGVEMRSVDVEKRGGQCTFPTDAGLVAVTPNQENAGWAMSPNQPCTPGNYCPYACPSGQVSMQWDPSATSYTYPESMVSQGSMSGACYADNSRMAVYIATRMATSKNPFQASHTAKTAQHQSALLIMQARRSPSARQFFLETKLC